MSDYRIQTNREWWAQRWVDVLESFGWIRRLERARNYARQGNVLSIVFKDHKVFAQVQGTAPEPYQVSLALDPFTEEQWNYVIETMSEQAIFSAKLLAGEMPHNIEEVFTANGLSLFPLTKFDIHSRCSCPDPANPCKHIGAVYYLLGDRFSEDPFVLFQLRGRSKDQIIQALRQIRRQASDNGQLHGEVEATASPTLPATSPPDLEQFWQYKAQLESSLVVITPPPTSETILDLLGPMPIKASEAENTASAEEVIMDYLRTLYQHVGQAAVMAAMSTDPSDGRATQ